jgi:hypothetical protein
MPYKDQQSEAAKASRKKATATYKKNHPDKYREIHTSYHRKWAKTPQGKRSLKAASLRCRIGVELAVVEAAIESQNNLCLVCNQPLDLEGWGGPAADHCHYTDSFRGVLHRTCNAAIGLLRDDPRLLRQAAEYLENHSVHKPQ